MRLYLGCGFCILMASMFLVRAFRWPEWLGVFLPLAVAPFCYVACVLLSRRYIVKNAPHCANEWLTPRRIYIEWESWARSSVVPKWISLLGLLAVSCLYAPLVWVAFELVTLILSRS